MISSTPQSNFKRYQRMMKQTEESSRTKEGTTILAEKKKANLLLSPTTLQQKKNDHLHHHRQSWIETTTSSSKCCVVSSTFTNGIIVLSSTPSPRLTMTRMIRCIPSSSSSTAKSPKSTAAAAGSVASTCNTTAAIHALRMSATPSPLALRIRHQQILKSNEKAPEAATPSTAVLSSAKTAASAVFFTLSSPRPRSCGSVRGSSTPRGAPTLVSQEVTTKLSLTDKNQRSSSVPIRTCLQNTSTGGVSIAALTTTTTTTTAASFQSPSPTWKMSNRIHAAAETRPISVITKQQKHHFISPPPTSSLQESCCNCDDRHQNITSPTRHNSIPNRKDTTTAGSTKPVSATTKTNTIAKTDIVRKQDANNADSKSVVAPPRSWSHEQLMAWLTKHELLDSTNVGNKSSSSSSSKTIPSIPSPAAAGHHSVVNGQMVMCMSKERLLDTFYGNRDCPVNQKKAETLFRRLRLERDRADRLQLLLKKQRVAVVVTKGTSSFGK
jgi:hypothetical protein